MALTPGDAVQTAFGKGIVREVRNSGRMLVEVGGRNLTLDAAAVTPLDSSEAARRKPKRAAERLTAGDGTPAPARRSREIDLHGLTVEEALARSERALNDALLADSSDLRLIHGKSGHRIRDALHRWLAQVPTVRHVRLDPGNAGVTIAEL